MKRCLITAGANGIGLVMARAFADAGYRVWVTDVDQGAVAALPPGIRGTVCDASSEAAMELLFTEVAADWGGLDVLCANAGIKGPTAAIEDMPLEGWHQCIGVNLDGAMLAAKYGARLMKTVAMELGPHGIRANAICPGSVNGPRIDRVIAAEATAKGTTPEAIRQGYASGTALKRLSDPEDVAHMALFLASDGARMVSGQALTVDGFTINPDP